MRTEKLKELKEMLNELKSIEIKITDDNPSFLKSEVYECVLNNGEKIKREKLIKGNTTGNAVAVIPITKENNVILTVEPRVFTKETASVGIPSGYVEEGEKAESAVIRELREETGYEPRSLISLGGYYQDEGCSSAYNNLFIAIECEKKYDQSLDKDEYVKYFQCTYEEALELLENGYINGSNSVIALERSRKYMKVKK